MADLIPYVEISSAIFTEPGGVEKILSVAEEIVSRFVPDMSTEHGRKEIASFAYRIARSKTAIDKQGESVVAEWKRKSSQVDRDRKFLRDKLDAMKDAVRRPLTEYENAEKKRVEDHRAAIKKISDLVSWIEQRWDVIGIIQMSMSLEEIQQDRDWEEFAEEAYQIIDDGVQRIIKVIKRKENYLEANAELDRLRKELEERKQKDREKEIKEEAKAEVLREIQDKNLSSCGLQIAEKRKQAEEALMSFAKITKDQAFDVFLSIVENKIPYLRFFDETEATGE